MATDTVTASPPSGPKLSFDPTIANRIPIKFADTDSKVHYNTVLFNHRPPPQDDLEQVVSYSVDPSGRPSLSITNVEPGSIPEEPEYLYRGMITSNTTDSYFLLFDPQTNTCKLTTVDSALAFNLFSSPNPSSPDKPGTQPQVKLPVFSKQNAPESEKTKDETEETNWLKISSTDAETTNPYDFRHHIDGPIFEASQSITPPVRSPSPNNGGFSATIPSDVPFPKSTTAIPSKPPPKGRNAARPTALRLGQNNKKDSIPEVKITKPKSANSKTANPKKKPAKKDEKNYESSEELIPKTKGRAAPAKKAQKSAAIVADLSDDDELLELVTAGLSKDDDDDDALEAAAAALYDDDDEEEGEDDEIDDNMVQEIAKPNNNRRAHSEEQDEDFDLTTTFIPIPPLEKLNPDADVIDFGALDPMDYDDEENEDGTYVDVDDLFNMTGGGDFGPSTALPAPTPVPTISSSSSSRPYGTLPPGLLSKAGSGGGGGNHRAPAVEKDDPVRKEERSYEEIVASLMASDDDQDDDDDTAPSQFTMPQEEEESDVSEEE